MWFSGKLSNLASCNGAFQRTDYWIHKIQDGWDRDVIFSADGGPSWIKCWRLVQNDRSTAVMWSKSKPGVEFQYGGHFLRIQWHVIPEPPATLQGAATWQIQCHDSRATCHIAGCCRRANSMACHPRTTYHSAGCCHMVNSLSRFQSHMPHCRVQSPVKINVMIVPHCSV